MQIDFLALYAGPDQVMGVTSGLAGLLGLLMIFWNKLVAAFFKAIRIFRGGDKSDSPAPAGNTPGQDS
jgi:hypothetical protein